jgi:AcrR family transcriptional regulator
MKSKKFSASIRRRQIIDAAIRLAIKCGYQNVTRNAVAEEAGVSHGLVNTYFSTMPQLKRALMRAAIAQEIVEIIAQGLGAKDADALKVSDELKKKAVTLLMK